MEPCFQPWLNLSWNLPGTLLEPSPCATLVEPCENLPATLLEDCWNLPGTFVVPFGTFLEPVLEPCRNLPGTFLDLCWNRAGNFLERSWTFAGTSLEPCWNFCVSALVTVRCLVVILSPQTSFRVFFVFCCYVVCFISMILPLLNVLGCYKHLGQRGEHT